ncbi:DNA-binding response regulator [uncultured Parabacteroides sp.]|uniref:DNA-binding response regulator n=1 Tax=uncultured Parabacteroides sp. TaxID=512312 RepID=UPI00265A4713|nr:DNA-binding response regulator [uncultured Parabacteroides sp.]
MEVFKELTPECDITAQMYAAGYEKKEIAVLKHRAVSTINNQLQTAFLILGVRNGRELAIKLAERLSGIRLTLDFSPAMRSAVACVLLIILCLDSHFEMRRQRTRTRLNTNVELIARTRARAKGRDIPLLYGN